jgi:hypothetical protein
LTAKVCIVVAISGRFEDVLGVFFPVYWSYSDEVVASIGGHGVNPTDWGS